MNDTDPAAPRTTAAPASTQRSDVVIVGAGPAGSAAAIHLARAGASVTLVDKATFPRDKCCGDGLTTLALRELEHAGFEPAMVDDWQTIDAAWLRTPSGRHVTVPLPHHGGTYAAITPRSQLDDALVTLAATEGARVLTGVGVTGLDVVESGGADDGDATVVLDDDTTLATRHVIAADGMWSPVRKTLGLAPPGYLGEWHAVRQYVSGVTGPAAERLYVWFDADLLPGYAWSFPLPDGRANLGFGVLRADGRAGKEIKQLWAGLVERDHIRTALGPDARLEGRHLAWPIPARVDRAVLHHRNVLFVGDAAGASDVLTGEGIGQALVTARLAAECLTTDDTTGRAGSGRSAGERYAEAVREELVADHKMAALLGRILAHRRGANGSLAIVAKSGSWGRRNFARWMFEDEPRSIIATPKRWHRHVLARPGAFVDPQ